MPISSSNSPTSTSSEKKAAGNVFTQPLSVTFGANKISAKSRMIFTERLALLLETGTALAPSLEALNKQADDPAMGHVVDDILNSVSTGQSFSQALAKHPDVFPSTYVHLIAASEQGGFMDRVLAQLLEMDRRREELNTTLIMAFVYPAFLLFFAVAVVIFVLTWVFPRFATMFERLGDRLPFSTKILMSVSDFVTSYWVFIIGGLIGGIVFIVRWLKTESGSNWMDGIKLKTPGLNDVYKTLYLIRSLRVLSLSLGNGVNIVDALNSCRESVPNRVFRRFLNTVEDSVKHGQGIAAGFNRPDLIPPVARQMIDTGEASGNIAMVMGRLADDMESSITKKVKMLSKIAEPVLLLTMGVVVGFVVSALILPIFKISGAVQ